MTDKSKHVCGTTGEISCKIAPMERMWTPIKDANNSGCPRFPLPWLSPLATSTFDPTKIRFRRHILGRAIGARLGPVWHKTVVRGEPAHLQVVAP